MVIVLYPVMGYDLLTFNNTNLVVVGYDLSLNKQLSPNFSKYKYVPIDLWHLSISEMKDYQEYQSTKTYSVILQLWKVNYNFFLYEQTN